MVHGRIQAIGQPEDIDDVAAVYLGATS
jgi:hypothetical protein